MDFLRIAIALALPWLLGVLFVHRLVPDLGAGRRGLVLGYGYLAGVLGLTVAMRGLDAAGFGIDLGNLLLFLLPLIALGGLLAYRCKRPLGGAWLSQAYYDLSLWQKILIAVLLVVMAVRVGGLWLEIYWRPLFPWDAFMHWATKARVWTDARSIQPFVDYDRWLALHGHGVFTDDHPDYPITIPLLQTWMNLVLGRWDDALMNLPWVLLTVAGSLAFFGQARVAGVGLLAALLFCYLLLSLPILNLQVALAGYADIFMGIYYLAAVMAFYQWSRTRLIWQGALALVLATSCLLIKNEGLFWLLAFAPGVAVLVLPKRWFLLAAGLGFLSGIAILGLFPRELEIAGHTLGALKLDYRSEALIPLLQSLFVFSNWHLLFWVVGGLLSARIVAGLLTGTPWPRPLFALGMVLGTAFVFFLVLFLFTKYAGGAVRHTAVSRITLQIAPALVFFAMLLYQDLASMRIGSGAQSPRT